MDKVWVLFDDVGRITDTLCLNEDLAPPDGALELVAGVMMADLDYYVDVQAMAVQEKAHLPIASEIDGLSFIINNVPTGTYVSVDGNTFLVDDGIAEIEFDRSGVYKVRVDPPPQYKAENLEVTIG